MMSDVLGKIEKNFCLNVVFKDGTVMIFKSYEYDKYEIGDGMLKIYNRDNAVGFYNIDCIEAIIPPKY